MHVLSIILILFIELFLYSCTSRDTVVNSSTGNVHPDTIRIQQLGEAYKRGKVLFGQFCSVCHSARAEINFMDRIFERLPEPAEDYFIKFVSNSKSLRASGDKYALALAEKWNLSGGTSF